MKTFLLISILLFTYYLNAQKQIPLDSVSTYAGQFVKICEKINDIYRPTGENKNIYINFGGK